MTTDDYRKTKKEKSKALKKYSKAVKTMIISLGIGLLSAFFFPENLFRLLGTGLTKILGESISNLIVVLTEGIGIFGGMGGFIAGAHNASKAKEEMNKLDEKEDDYIYEITKEIESLNKEIESLQKENVNSKEKQRELQNRINELMLILEEKKGKIKITQKTSYDKKLTEEETEEKHYNK